MNVEIKKSGSNNCILNVSPGSIKGTSFNNGKTDLAMTERLASEIIEHLEAKMISLFRNMKKSLKMCLHAIKKIFVKKEYIVMIIK